jgi:hypothetical protein
MMLTMLDKQPVLEAEFPYYSNRRFTCAKDRQFIASDTTYNPGYQSHKVTISTSTKNGTISSAVILERYISVGEDFLLAGFQGCPPITNSIWSP